MTESKHEPNVRTADDRRERPVRSFVLRQGRMTDAQKRALQELWPRYGLDYAGTPRDLDAVFGRTSERVLEIGFGNGEAMRYATEHEPARDFIGVEVHQPGVGRLLNALAAANLPNARVYCHDAVEVLRDELAPDALDEVRIYFPDPWHKKRHHKRRLVQPDLVALIASRLRPGGLLHLATDWQEYAEHMYDVLDASADFVNVAGPRTAVERPAWRPQTHFETRGQRLGHGVWDLLYRRIG